MSRATHVEPADPPCGRCYFVQILGNAPLRPVVFHIPLLALTRGQPKSTPQSLESSSHRAGAGGVRAGDKANPRTRRRIQRQFIGARKREGRGDGGVAGGAGCSARGGVDPSQRFEILLLLKSEAIRNRK
ncbi:hypothetical protein ZWY2020_025370 [Hordeum vulgare]|nr:hypothetical protein ZWY2020_025370 [Hordeum vulgare]